MSEVLDRIHQRARAAPRRVVLVEGADERVVRAAARVAREGWATVSLGGDAAETRRVAREAGVKLDDVALLDPADTAEIERTRMALIAARGERLDAQTLERASRDSLFQAAARVRDGRADCLIAGAVRTSADVLRATLWLIGLASGVSRVSSFFLMVVPPRDGRRERVLVFADCAVVPEPDAVQLADIGVLAADRYARLTGGTPRVAFLSYSTRGSAEHPRVENVRAATARARTLRPDLAIDGELQADAALDPGVAARKTPGGVLAGDANVLVFPDLDSGNIGYKLVERLAGAAAYGPILMGLRRQSNDLSRGCSADDVAEVTAIACVLADAVAIAPNA